MDPRASWDWTLFYYMGTVILRMSPRTFWRTTPKKFFALLQVHVELNEAPDKHGKKHHQRNKPSGRVGGVGQPDVYVDQLSFM